MSGAEPACWVCQFAECEGNPDELLLSTGCACCREGSSGGRAHVSCVARRARRRSTTRSSGRSVRPAGSTLRGRWA